MLHVAQPLPQRPLSQLDAASAQLDALKGQHNDLEAQLRSNKKKATGELEAALQQYDTDVGAKEEQLQ